MIMQTTTMRAQVVACILLSSIALTGSLSEPADIQQEEYDHVLATTITVDSTNLRFSPSDVTISEGETVRFLWSGELLPHNAVESEGVFDSGEPSRNVDYIFTFEIGMNGTYEYVCEPHEDMGMVGTIVVEALNTTEEEEPGEIQEQADEERSLSAPFLAGIVSLAMASLIVDLRLSREGDQNE
jgi:plastocyanin|tara:strand:- start:656 stop:1207 length:552 start_codon:yes stop_codon:yes gene_type:complete